MQFKPKRDKDLARQGVWLTYEDETTGEKLECRLAAHTSRQFKLELGRKVKPGKDNTEVMIALLAEHILLDWREMWNGDAAVEPTLENKIAFLGMNEEFRDWVAVESQSAANFKATTHEVAATEQDAIKSRSRMATEERQA